MLTMLSAIAELERDLLIERTHAGLERAKKEGKKLGRRPKLTAYSRKAVVEEFGQGKTITKISQDYEVSRATVMRAVIDSMGDSATKTLAAIDEALANRTQHDD
jgi:putative DNA-invertase from lambdoid prophage Rac